MPEVFEYRLEWDPIKAKKNDRQHGVTFEQASTVFLDPSLLSQIDQKHGDEEERWISLGLDKSGRLLVVCHTYRSVAEQSANIRIVTARKATSRETRDYENRRT